MGSALAIARKGGLRRGRAARLPELRPALSQLGLARIFPPSRCSPRGLPERLRFFIPWERKESGYAIGSLYQIGDEIRGERRSLTTSPSVASVPVHTSTGSVARSHVVVASRVEVGAAWPAVPRPGIVLKVRIDDSTFPSPLVGT